MAMVLGFLRRKGPDAEKREARQAAPPAQQPAAPANRHTANDEGNADLIGDLTPARRQGSQINLNKYCAQAPHGLAAVLKSNLGPNGTIKMLAYLVLLFDPTPHPLLCVEEPENQLYPSLLWDLAEEFRSYGELGGQVFVTTHSPDFLNAVHLDEVFWLVKEGGYTSVHRAKDDAQLKAYVDEGDQLGYLWNSGLFVGVHP